jgi:hypothetical protein
MIVFELFWKVHAGPAAKMVDRRLVCSHILYDSIGDVFNGLVTLEIIMAPDDDA